MPRPSLATLLVAIAIAAGAAGAPPDDRILRAVREQDRQAVRALLDRKADVNTPSADGATALHWAVHRDDFELVTLLLRAGARADAATDLGVTPLALASANGNAEIVAALIEAKANANAVVTGEPVLIAAARSGSVAAVDALLRAGAAVDAREEARGQTALMTAAAHRHAAVTALLLKRGADAGLRSSVAQQWVMRGNRYGGVVGRERGLADRAVAQIPSGGSTPILFAARSGDAESARLLLAAGANRDDRMADGTSALVLAVHSGHRAVAQLLLEAGAGVDSAEAGYTALHAAVLTGDDVMVAALIARGATVNAPVSRGTPSRRYSKDLALSEAWVGATPFWLAARFGELSIAKALLAAGADARIVAADGTTAAMAAVDAGADFGPSAADQRDRRLDPLELAAKVERQDDYDARVAEMVALVLDAGVDVNAADRGGDTALHLAAAKGFTRVARALVDHGAALSPKNHRGQTPLALTRSARLDEGAPSKQGVMDLLRERGALE